MKATVNRTALVACCITDDLLKTLRQKDDPLR